MKNRDLLETQQEKAPFGASAEGYRFGERFAVESLVGSGGMGMVFRGRDLLDGKAVALKVLHHRAHKSTDRFLREAEALAALSHPAIVRYVAHGITLQGEPYLAMEWLDGETLADRLARGAIGVLATARLGGRVLRALAIAHMSGLIHRDIKPSNLFLPEGDLEQAKLLDFGIVLRTQSDLTVTKAGAIVGTPMYMAPEQSCVGESVDRRADIFSLGCVLYECATGQPFRQQETDHASESRNRLKVPPVCPQLDDSRPLREVLMRMVTLDPARRPNNAQALADELALVAMDLATAESKTRSEYEHPALSVNEARVESVVLAAEGARTIIDSLVDPGATALQALLAKHGGRAERTSDGSTVIVFRGGLATPIDRATQAARCSLQVNALWPEVSLIVNTGRAHRSGEPFPGGGFAHAMSMLAATPAGAVHIDEFTARLLETRFAVEALRSGTSRLLFEKGIREAPPTFMGKKFPCFGREREIGLLETLWDEACSESAARVMLLTGEAGSGKSRVRFELCDRLERRGHPFELLIGCGDPMRDAAPFALLSPALLGAAGVTGSQPEAVQRKRLIAHVSRVLPVNQALPTAAFLGEMARMSFPDENLALLRTARQHPRLMADQMLVAWLDWLEAECSQHPVLLVLEDLHWGDAPSVHFVDMALRVLAEKPFMVLALARPDVDRRFPSLWRERNLQRVNLAPLSIRWSQRMVEGVIGNLPGDSMRWIVERAQGNPLFLQELLRVVVDGRQVGSDRELPDSILGVVQARFDRFGPDPKLVLRAGSLFGQAFQAEGVKALLSHNSRKDVDRWLEILTKQEILFVRQTGSTCEHVFRHALLRQAAYEMLPLSERRLGHLLVGRYLEHVGESNGAILATHFESAGDNARAVHWLTVAAQQALDADDLAETLARIERAMRLGASGEELYAMQVIASQACFWRGDYVEAERLAREAIKSGKERTRLMALTALFDALGSQAKYDEIVARYGELEQPEAPDLFNCWVDYVLCATAHLAASGDNEIRSRTLSLLQAFEYRLEPIQIGRTMTLRAHLARTQHKPRNSCENLRLAVDYYRSIGHLRAASEALGNLGVSLCELGQLEEAERCLRQVLATAERLDSRHLVGGCLQGLANVLAFRGRLDEARTMGERAVSVTMAQHDRYFQGFAEVYLSLIEYLAGDYERASHLARAALSTWETQAAKRPFALSLLARALLAQGHTSQALVHAGEAYRQFERCLVVDDGESTIRLALVECLLATGNRPAAKDILDRATTWLRTCADTIDDPAIRYSFLTRIPDHRRLLELDRELIEDCASVQL